MHIELDKATKSYGDLRALDGVNLGIEPGQIVAVLGPNGAGKTTLFRALTGIVSLDRGRILYDGTPFHRGRLDIRRQLFFLPDFPAVFPNMTPLRHLGMACRIYEADPANVESRAIDAFRELDLLPHTDAPLAFLSRGQIYKSALTACVALDCDVWLLDEPFASGMDPSGLMAFKRYARDARARGRTVIYSTQILEVNEGFCDRICVIHKGRVEAFATFDELRERVGRQDDVLAGLFQSLREVPR